VEEFLPPAIRQNGAPLTVIYSILEEGLRNKSDEQCVELAEQVREVLVYVVTQIEQSKRASRRLTQLMQHVSPEGSVFEKETGNVEVYDPLNQPQMAPREPTPPEPAPVEPTPRGAGPGEPTPRGPAPVETTPVETTPVETTPVETAPVTLPRGGHGADLRGGVVVGSA
jgi:hypothetical protein